MVLITLRLPAWFPSLLAFVFVLRWREIFVSLSSRTHRCRGMRVLFDTSHVSA